MVLDDFFHQFSHEEKELSLAVTLFLGSLGDIYFSAESMLEIYMRSPKYRDLFFFDRSGELSSKDDGMLQEFITEVHDLEIGLEFKRMDEEGICDHGIDSYGEVVYLPRHNLTSEDLLDLAIKRLDEKSQEK